MPANQNSTILIVKQTRLRSYYLHPIWPVVRLPSQPESTAVNNPAESIGDRLQLVCMALTVSHLVCSRPTNLTRRTN